MVQKAMHRYYNHQKIKTAVPGHRLATFLDKGGFPEAVTPLTTITLAFSSVSPLFSFSVLSLATHLAVSSKRKVVLMQYQTGV